MVLPCRVVSRQNIFNKKNRKFLTKLNIKIYGKPLGRPKQETKTSAQRYRDRKKEAVEGKFEQTKRGYGLIPISNQNLL